MVVCQLSKNIKVLSQAKPEKGLNHRMKQAVLATDAKKRRTKRKEH
jgi:hypothetical protein